MPPAPRLINEEERLNAVYAYRILDTLPEKDFDDITLIASQICGTPVASISIIDKDRQWLKSVVGFENRETSRDVSFCSYAINQPGEMLMVTDARNDIRFKDNPLVNCDDGIMFYAGVPLCVSNGHALGALCVVDTKPNKLNEEQQKALTALANQVTCQLELRKKNRELALSRFSLQEINEELEKFAQVVAHDLKSPCNNIIGLSDILKESVGTSGSKERSEIIQYINDSACLLKQLIDDILVYSRSVNFSQEMILDFTVRELIQSAKGILRLPDNFELFYEGDDIMINSSKAALLQILLNLLNNAIRFNDKEKGLVLIRIADAEEYYHFVVKDNGPGIHPDNLNRIFEPDYTTQVGPDRSSLLGQGIGLSTVKRLINKLGGEISVESKLKEWTEFKFSIAK